MNFPKHFVTYGVMDRETGSNPFGHASLILSKQMFDETPIVVIDSFGFYSQPSTTTNPFIKGLKHILGFTINLQDGHGELKQEAMRYLDGNGLHGVSFIASKEQFEALISLYQQKIVQEQAAIKELDTYLTGHGEVANTNTRYIRERSLAELQKRPPRLNPFHVVINLTRTGLDSSASQTCKTYALNLLLQTGIINETTRDAINGGLAKYALPRYSELPILPFRLVSTGEPETQRSRTTKATFYNRNWKNNSLFWASPIHIHSETPSELTLSTTKNPYPTLKNILTRVKKTDNCLRHKIDELNIAGKIDEQIPPLKEQLERVQALFPLFSNAYENQRSDCLATKLLRAEKTLNVAIMSLTPKKANHSFMLRACESMSVIYALLGLLMLLLALSFLDNSLSPFLMTASTAFTGYQLLRFFKEETAFTRMRTDYTAFLQTRPNIREESEKGAGSEARDRLASTLSNQH